MVAVGVVSLICIHGSALQDIFPTGVQYMSGNLGVARAQDKLLGKKKKFHVPYFAFTSPLQTEPIKLHIAGARYCTYLVANLSSGRPRYS